MSSNKWMFPSICKRLHTDTEINSIVSWRQVLNTFKLMPTFWSQLCIKSDWNTMDEILVIALLDDNVNKLILVEQTDLPLHVGYIFNNYTINETSAASTQWKYCASQVFIMLFQYALILFMRCGYRDISNTINFVMSFPRLHVCVVTSQRVSTYKLRGSILFLVHTLSTPPQLDLSNPFPLQSSVL